MRVTRYVRAFTSIRLPTAAPYDTADWPSYGPPRSFKVTLAADRRLTLLVATAAAG
jgi:hypothetical protein